MTDSVKVGRCAQHSQLAERSTPGISQEPSELTPAEFVLSARARTNFRASPSRPLLCELGAEQVNSEARSRRPGRGVYARVGFLRLNFFVYSRDAVGTARLRDDQELLEKHWSYMDRFAESMIARGPTLDTDRETATGSLHVLALPGVEAAREFVALEPNNLAGVYGEHFVWRFENLLGRSMWEFSEQAAEPRFLIIGRSHLWRPVAAEALPAELLDRLIFYGAVTTLDRAEPVGVALAVQAPDREAVDALMHDERIGLDASSEVDVHNWEFGGRR